MVRNLYDRARSEESGFTIIELLVAVVIIGVLAAIAIPAFLGQREKAEDAAAKTAISLAASAANSYHVDKDTYADMDVAALEKVEPSLAAGPGTTLVISGTGRDTYDFDITSESGNRFTWSESRGVAARTCTDGGRGGCPGDGTW